VPSPAGTRYAAKKAFVLQKNDDCEGIVCYNRSKRGGQGRTTSLLGQRELQTLGKGLED